MFDDACEADSPAPDPADVPAPGELIVERVPLADGRSLLLYSWGDDA